MKKYRKLVVKKKTTLKMYEEEFRVARKSAKTSKA